MEISTDDFNPKSSVPCRTVAFSDDNNYLVEVNYLGFITIRSTQTGQVINRFMGQTTLSETIRFEPKTNILYVAGAGFEGYRDFGCVKAYEIPSGKRIMELTGHTDDVIDLCFLSGNVRTVVTVGLDGRVIVHNLIDNTQWCWEDYNEYINACFSRPNHDGQFAIAGDSDFTYVLDANKQIVIAKVYTPNDTNGLIWSNDGRFLIVGGDNLDMQYFDSKQNWEKSYRIYLGGSVKKTCYDPLDNSKGLAACYDGQIWSFPLFPQKEAEVFIVVKKRKGIWGTNVAASKNLIAIPSFGDRAFLFKRDNNGVANVVIGKEPKATYGCNWISINKKNEILVTSHDDGMLRFRNINNGNLIKELATPSNSLFMGVDFHPTLSILGVIDFQGKVYIIDYEKNAILDEKQMPFGPGITLQFNRQGNFLAVGGYGPDGWVLFIDKTGKIENSIKLDHPNTGVVKSIIFTDNNEIVVGSGDGSIVHYSYKDKNWFVSSRVETDMELCNAVTYSTQKNIVFTGARDQTIRAIDLTQKKEINRGYCHTRSIKSIQISDCERFVATGSYDRSIIIWDSKSLLAVLPPLRIANAGFSSVKFYRNMIFACSFDGYVCCWDMEGSLLWAKDSINHKNKN